MNSLPPGDPNQKFTAWLRYYEDLRLGPFYRDRRSPSGAPLGINRAIRPPAIAATPIESPSAMPVAQAAPRQKQPASAPRPLASPLSSSLRSAPPAAAPAPLPILQAPSLFHASERIEGDTLERIREDLGDCTRCRLHKTRNKIVFGVGNPKASLLFVGEGPGHDEDIQGIPFVGRAGKLLTQMIEAMGLRRDDVYIANVVKCRPPENRPPEKDEVATCSPYLFRQIDAIRPKVIVCLGNVATQSLLGTTKSISQYRGQWVDYRGSRLIPTYHPAYLLRNPAAKSDVWLDLKKVMVELGLPLNRSRRAD
ncbi:MAG: uracil-DNA glycosylase [Candidatus Acidiferrales bacterium]